MNEIPFDQTWFLYREDEPQFRYRAPVPGSVHDALLAADAVPDAHHGFNETDQMWIGDHTWIYETSFELKPAQLHAENVDLVCEGLDTLCEIFINDVKVAAADNMFRNWRFPVKERLQVGMHTIRLRFSPAAQVMAAGTAQRHLPAWNEPPVTPWGPVGRAYVRKQACQFGWDWGPQCPSAGPWLPLYLEAWSTARIADWHHGQEHRADGAVQLSVCVHPSGPADLRIQACLSLAGELIAEVDEAFWGGWEWRPLLQQPALWWPNGMGDQPLYTLQLTLLDGTGKVIDYVEKRIGLRRIELVRERDEFGRSMFFRVNGRDLFAKGANWIPLDTHPSSRNIAERYRQSLGDAHVANMNMLRVWGGGYFSHDVFYDICDELGLLVWQDLMFGCGTYPIWDKDFQQTVWQETVDNARRLRHHACIACWCGNNELEQGFTAPNWQSNSPATVAGKMAWASYLELFERILPSALALADPATPYIPGSPHSCDAERRNPFSERSGDLHSWDVWFHHSQFEKYRENRHRFLSEFGFQSFPSAKRLRKYSPQGEALQLGHPWLDFRQRSQPSNQRVINATTDFFGPQATDDFDRFCTLSQIAQGLGLKTGIEYWRTTFPRCGGATYWQINDRWVAPTWATVDADGWWKASHYFARRFFAPQAIVGIENATDGNVEVFLLNDGPHPLSGTACIQVTNAAGEILLTDSMPAISGSNSLPLKLTTLNLATRLGRAWDPANCLVWLDWTAADGDSEITADNLVTFVRPHQLPVAPPELEWHCHPGPVSGMATVHLHCRRGPALWIWFEHPQVEFHASEQFFSLRHGESVDISLIFPSQLAIENFITGLRATSARVGQGMTSTNTR